MKRRPTRRPRLPALSGAVLLLALTTRAAIAAEEPDEETRRVALISRVERSVAVVLVEGLSIDHTERKVALVPSESLGTGVVLSADGLVLTAAHVVAEAGRVRVKAGNGEPAPAHILFSDSPSDIALLRLDEPPGGLVAAELGDSDLVRKGETVYVLGNPSGIERSLSAGVVSGRHRVRHVFGGSVEAELIQTDAAINSGNSGGPIFNSRGEVIAIAQSILTQGGGSEGLGFGLSINAVKKILGLDPCIWLGFSGVPLNEEWAAALNVPAPGGLLVERVTPGGPADHAGIHGGLIPIQIGAEHVLLGGDVILTVDGQPVLDWIRSPSSIGAGGGDRHELRLTILRSGKVLEIPIVSIHRKSW